MNLQNFKTGYNKPTIITAEQYGTKISVELDHSDTDIDELFDAFQTLVVGLGYHKSAWREWVLDRADEYREEDSEEKEAFIKQYEYELEQRRFSEEDVRTIIKANENPSEPNENLKKAAKKYKANLPLNFNGYEGDNFEDYQHNVD